jgi:hydroxyacylglutathione hydrolase
LRHSPALAFGENEKRFIDFILADQPEPPLYFARMKRDNRDGPPVLGELPEPTCVSADDLARASDVMIVDLRSWDDFRAGHLPGSLWAPINSHFCAVPGSYIEESQSIALVVDAGQLDEAIRRLVRIGLDHVVSWTTPESMIEFGTSGGVVETIKDVHINEADLAGDVTALDVRKSAEHAMGSIAGTCNITHTNLPRQFESIPKDKPVLIHCAGGTRSAYASALLKRLGYDVVNLSGGYEAWEKAGNPVMRQSEQACGQC